MIKIAKEFMQEVDFICKINEDSHRKLNWVIAPKEPEYDSDGEELFGKSYMPELQLFDLIIVENNHEIAGKDNQIIAFDEPLTSSDFDNIFTDILDDMEQSILKERCPVEIDAETDPDEYTTKEEQYKMWIEAWCEADRKIAEIILQRIKMNYNLNDDTPIRVYAGDTQLISNVQSERVKEVTEEEIWEAREDAVLDTKYAGITPRVAIDIHDAVINNRKFKEDDMYWMMMLKYAKKHIR